MKIIPDEKILKKLTDYWIGILGLQEWEIVSRIKRKTDMLLDCVGDVSYQFIHKKAIVSVIDPMDWNNNLFKQDMEETLVHELLHLKFSIMDDTEEESDNHIGVLSHQLLCDMARSFMKLKEPGK